MGALLGLGIGFGILALVLGGGDKGPQPKDMIGTPVLRVTAGVHILTITRTGQGYAWYVGRGGHESLESGQEGGQLGAFTVGMEALQGYADGPLRMATLVEPLAVGSVDPVGAADGPWSWTAGPLSGQEPTRGSAALALFNALTGEAVPPQPEGDNGIVGEPVNVQAGLQISGDCTEINVVNLDAWKDAAAPVVVDAIEAEITDGTEFADAVFANTVGCDTEDLVINGQSFSPGQVQDTLDEIYAGTYSRVESPDRRLAGLLVRRGESGAGQAGRAGNYVWVAVPSGLATPWRWMVFEGIRGLDTDAIAEGFGNTLVEARQAALNRIHEEPKTAALDEA